MPAATRLDRIAFLNLERFFRWYRHAAGWYVTMTLARTFPNTAERAVPTAFAIWTFSPSKCSATVWPRAQTTKGAISLSSPDRYSPVQVFVSSFLGRLFPGGLHLTRFEM